MQKGSSASALLSQDSFLTRSTSLQSESSSLPPVDEWIRSGIVETLKLNASGEITWLKRLLILTPQALIVRDDKSNHIHEIISLKSISKLRKVNASSRSSSVAGSNIHVCLFSQIDNDWALSSSNLFSRATRTNRFGTDIISEMSIFSTHCREVTGAI